MATGSNERHIPETIESSFYELRKRTDTLDDTEQISSNEAASEIADIVGSILSFSGVENPDITHSLAVGISKVIDDYRGAS